MANRLYTQREVASIFRDVPNKTLIYWARQSLVEWAAETRDARGIARLYNRWNLFQLGLVRELAGLGISTENIRLQMGGFKDFPQSYTYDNEGNEVPRPPASESFYSESGSLHLVIIKKVTDRDWHEPIAAAVGTLKMVKKGFGKLMSLHTTVTINLSVIDGYVGFLMKEADLS